MGRGPMVCVCARSDHKQEQCCRGTCAPILPVAALGAVHACPPRLPHILNCPDCAVCAACAVIPQIGSRRNKLLLHRGS